MRQNRRYARRQSIGRVKVSWKAEGRGITEWGMIQDRSEGGLGMKIPRAIKTDSIIAVSQGFSTMFGIVRHCTKVNGHFFIGVEFCAVEETSKQPSAGAGGVAVSSDSDEDKKPMEEPSADTEPDSDEDDADDYMAGVSFTTGPRPGARRVELKPKRVWE